VRSSNLAAGSRDSYACRVPSPRSSLSSRWATLPIRGLLALVPCFFYFLTGAFLSTATASSDYFTHLWQTRNGLPQNAVTAIVQTGDGYLWLGTYGGLVRFDGIRFTVFDNNTTPELKSSRVTSLFEDASGNLWIGQETGELTRYKNGRFEAMDATVPGRGRKILAIGTDEEANLWLVNDEGILTRLSDKRVLVPAAGTASGVLGFARDSSGHIWVVRHGRLSRLEHGHLVRAEFSGESPDVYVQGICGSRRGGLWIASNGRLRRWLGNQWAEDLGAAPWGVNGLTQIIETRTGALVGGTVHTGLYVIIPHKEVLNFNHLNGLPQDWVRALCEDHEGNIWLGAGSGGLVALRACKVATISPPDRWQGRAVLSVSAGRNEALWVSTEGAGLYRLQAGQWQQFGETNGLSNLFVWSVSEDVQGQLWAGTWGGGIFVNNGSHFARPLGLEDVTAPAPALLHTQNGVTWIGTDNGLIRYQSGSVTRFGEKEGLELPDVRTLLETPDGTIWFGMSGGGLGRLSDGILKQFRRGDGLSSDYVHCLRLESDGSLWIGTSGGGLNRFKQEHFAAITKNNGLADDVICHIEDDSRGYFWMSSHHGILRVSKEELNACADGRTNLVACLAYGEGEGLPTDECSGGLQPAGCRTADGRLWFPTSRGLVAVDPGDVQKNQLPPPVLVEEVLVDGHRLVENQAGAPPVRIPPGRHRFEFHYTGLSFIVPEKVRFKYRLEGLEPDWTDAGTKRTANYSYVPPGNYAFRVIACNNDDVWNEHGASLEFGVLPFFWQTWWFRMLAGLIACGGVAAAVLVATRRRMRHKLERLERQRAVERERARIAKDIHDDLGASLTRITMLSQSARAELGPSAAASDLDRIYDTAREVTRAMDEIVWAVNPRHDTLDSLATYLGRFAQDFLAAAHIKCRLDMPMQLPAWPLTAEVRHNLFLAFKEALNNAVKHSGTKEVRVSVSIDSTGFVLRVEDYGRGFAPQEDATRTSGDPARYSNGSGLANMRHRLDEIGGRFEMQTSPGAGTKVAFIVADAVPVS